MDIKVVEDKPKKKSRASWRPANIIEIPEKFKDPNFVYRCINKNRPGRILQKLREGWEIDKVLVPKMEKEGYFPDLPASLNDGLPKDSTLQFRELVVVRMPKEIAEERQKYHEEIDPLVARDKRYEDEQEGRAYGNIRVKR